jgi:hypothetical protein
MATSKLKGEEEPKRYLGATIDKYDLDGKICWSISAKSYLEKAIPTVEEEFGNLFKAFDKKAVSVPAPEKYHPKLDTTDFLNGFSHGLYQLHWHFAMGCGTRKDRYCTRCINYVLFQCNAMRRSFVCCLMYLCIPQATFMT